MEAHTDGQGQQQDVLHREERKCVSTLNHSAKIIKVSFPKTHFLLKWAKKPLKWYYSTTTK